MTAALILGGIPWEFPSALGKYSPPEKHIHEYSVTRGEPITPPSRKTRLPMVVYGDLSPKQSPYIPSGYMGDVNSLSLTSVYESAPLPGGQHGQTSLKITYSAKGSEGWAGIYWLTPANNWGRVKGAGFDLSKANRLTFWVRGEKGGEIINKIMLGGVTAGSYPDSDEASLGPVKLSKDWERYSIDLKGKDLRHIIGGFAFVIRRIDDRQGATFFLDEIVFEGPETPPTEVASSTETLMVEKVSPPPPLSEEAPDSNTAKLAEKSPMRRVIPFSTAFSISEEKQKKILEEFVKLAVNNHEATIVVEGHTDNIGPADMNLRLSKERATAVADYLVGQGVKRDRIIVIGYGQERPLAPHSNDTPEGRRENRRVEMVLIP